MAAFYAYALRRWARAGRARDPGIGAIGGKPGREPVDMPGIRRLRARNALEYAADWWVRAPGQPFLSVFGKQGMGDRFTGIRRKS